MKKRGFKMFLFRVCGIVLFIMFLLLAIDFVRFPECYLSTMKYQLQNDIKRGNEIAIEYYQDTYVENGRELFN